MFDVLYKISDTPKCTFQKNRRVNSHRKKYNLSTQSCGEACQESVLRVTNLTAKDYGNYTCTATNSKGHDSHTVMLSGTSE